ncbi:MAG: hypothetical protein GY794_00140 [bacterium]|nr:hypothetical protein [bacterium]
MPAPAKIETALTGLTTTAFATEFTKNGNGENFVTANGKNTENGTYPCRLCVLAVVVAFAVTKILPLPFFVFFVNSVAKPLPFAVVG